jgi:tape measure domain-containing protein
VSVVANVAINVDSSGAVSKLRQVQQGAQATSQAVDKLNATNDALAASFTKSGKPIQTAANGMRFFTDATGRARKENGQFVTTAEAAAAGLQKQGKAAQQAGASVSNFGGTVRALLGSFALIQSARFVFVKTAELESQTRSLEVLTGSAQKAGQIIKELQQLGAVTPFTSTELIDSAKRLQAFGVEADKVVETTKRLADVSGATGAELSGLVTAYGQVQAKGRLQGEELLQFQERGVALQTELRKMYGLSGEEFQKALEKGRIGSEAVEVAILRLTSAGGKYANGAIAQSDTLNGRLSTLQDSIGVLAQTIGSTLAPVFQWALTQATAVVSEIQRVIDEANNTGGARDREAQFARNADVAVRGMRLNPFTQQGMMADMRQRNIEQQRADYRLRQQTARTPSAPVPMGVPALLGGGGGGGRAGGAAGGASKAASDAKRAADEALRESQRVADVVRDQQFITKQKGIQTKFAQLISEAEQSADPIRVRQLQTVEALVLAGNETARLLEEEKNSVAQLAIARTRQGEAEAIRQEGAQDVLKLQLEQKKNFDEIIAGLDLELALKSATTEQAREQLRLANELAKLQGQGFTPEQIGAISAKKTELAAPKTDQQNITEKIGKLKGEVAELTNIGNIAITVADGIGVAFSQAFQGLISGSMSAEEALGSFFKSVGDMFVSMAAEIIAKQMTMIILQTILKALGAVGGGGGGFSGNAAGFGGSFDAGIPSIGNTTSFAGVFGRAGGGPAAGGTPYLVGERGPELFVPGSNGGVMSNNDLRSAMNGQGGGGSGSPVLNMSFESTTIGGVEYVSRDQLEQAMAETRRNASRDGAQRGMTMTLDRIQNSSSTRRRIGV